MIGMLVLGRPWEPAVATPLWPPLPHRQVEADAILRMALAIVIDSLKNLGHVVDNVERTMLNLKNLNEHKFLSFVFLLTLELREVRLRLEWVEESGHLLPSPESENG